MKILVKDLKIANETNLLYADYNEPFVYTNEFGDFVSRETLIERHNILTVIQAEEYLLAGQNTQIEFINIPKNRVIYECKQCGNYSIKRRLYTSSK